MIRVRYSTGCVVRGTCCIVCCSVVENVFLMLCSCVCGVSVVLAYRRMFISYRRALTITSPHWCCTASHTTTAGPRWPCMTFFLHFCKSPTYTCSFVITRYRLCKPFRCFTKYCKCTERQDERCLIYFAVLAVSVRWAINYVRFSVFVE